MKNTENELMIGKTAIILALASGKDEELLLKNKYTEEGYLCAVTATGAESSDLAKKINCAVIGACLNNNIIGKTPEEIHAVIHATMEAKTGILIAETSGASFAGKIAIVRQKKWIAVAIYGRSAAHVMTNHERIGLGIMHI